MEANPSVTMTDEPQWLHPVQLGSSTLLRLAESPATLQAVDDVLARLQPDPYIEFMRRYYALGRERFGAEWGYADQLTVLHAAARLLRPQRYLEIGVFRGRSLSVVAGAAPDCELYGFDLWVENYAGLENSGPELVRRQLERVGHRGRAEFVSGSSHETVPAFFAEQTQLDFDLVTVDGDHVEAGARRDLELVLPRLRVGGVLVFDDIRHPKFPWLERVWDEVVGAHPGFLSSKYTEIGHGVAFGIRRDADFGPLAGLHGDATERLKKLAAALDEVRRESDVRLEASEADRALRLQVIERQGRELGELAARFGELNARFGELQAYLQHVEQDRAARLAIIERQGRELGELAARTAALEQEQTRELLRLVRQGDLLEQAQAVAAQTVAGVLTPRKARRLLALLERMMAELAPRSLPEPAAP